MNTLKRKMQRYGDTVLITGAVTVDGILNRSMIFMLRFMPRSLVGFMTRLILYPEKA